MSQQDEAFPLLGRTWVPKGGKKNGGGVRKGPRTRTEEKRPKKIYQKKKRGIKKRKKKRGTFARPTISKP